MDSRLCRRLWNTDEAKDAAAAEDEESKAIAAIKALPCHDIAEGSAELTDGDEEAECALCLAYLAPGDRMRTLPCSHAFHQKCVDRWLIDSQTRRKRECPLCKADPLIGLLIGQQQPEVAARASEVAAAAADVPAAEVALSEVVVQ